VAIVRHGDVRLVLLEGPLDVYTVPILRRRTRARPAGDGRLVVDLTGVTLLDSSGLSALLQLRNHAAHDRPQLIGLICPPRLRRLFEIGGLLQAFAFGEDLPAVLAAMEAGNA
jgi:anti-anti-sigma factor